MREIDVLDGLPVLIVEDDQIVAANLMDAIEQCGGRAIGPAATVKQAMTLLEFETIGAAILDGNLLDRDVTPVALALVEILIPFVIHSGMGVPPELAKRHPNLPIVFKPAGCDVVLAALLQELEPPRRVFA